MVKATRYQYEPTIIPIIEKSFKWPWSHVYIMNLKHRTDRKKNVIKQLKKHNITNYTFIEAIDGKALRGDETDQEFTNRMIKEGKVSVSAIASKYRNYFKAGAIGVYLSFAKILDIALKESTGDILILEDDIDILDNFKEKLMHYYKKLPHDWDVFSLAWNKQNEFNTGVKVAKGILKPFDVCSHENKKQTLGLHAIIYRRRSLQTIRDKLLPLKVQLEKYLDLLKNTCLINFYICEKNLIVQNFNEFGTDIW